MWFSLDYKIMFPLKTGNRLTTATVIVSLVARLNQKRSCGRIPMHYNNVDIRGFTETCDN